MPASPFVAEVAIYPFNFAPTGWAFCHGQIMPIQQNTALFSLLGTTYGGDGISTFALPNLEGSVPVQTGQGQGLSLYDLGQQSGTEFITLLESEIPLHTHSVRAVNDPGEVQAPTSNRALARSSPGFAYQTTTNANVVQKSFSALAPSGGSLPHNNLQPYLTLSYCIAMQGVFPQRP